MEFAVKFFVIVSLLGAAQSLLLALVLVNIKRGNRTANRLLAAFAACVSILITWPVLVSSGYGHSFPHLFRVNHPVDFAAVPLLYLYVRALTARKRELQKKDLLHFIPAAVCALYLLPYYLQSSAAKLSLHNSLAELRWYSFRTSLLIPQALAYLTLSGILVVRYMRENRDKKSPAERAGFFQVKFLVISFMALWLVAVVRYLLDLRYSAYMHLTNFILPLGATMIIYSMAYLGLRKSETLAGAHDDASRAAADMPSAKKYERSTLTSDRAEAYLKKLLVVMEQDKPYLDGDLTLPKLAARLSLPTHHLSQIINERLNQNFFDLVNAHRVEEAKRKLVDPAKKHYSLLAIAEEVGFNSKSAFNAAFKKQANMTPSDFRKRSSGTGSDSQQTAPETEMLAKPR